MFLRRKGRLVSDFLLIGPSPRVYHLKETMYNDWSECIES